MKRFTLITLSCLLAACGTLGNKVISDQTLQEKAAFALDSTADQVTISNRKGDMNSVRFVATIGNKSHQCYVTTAAGVHVSDAICSGSNSVKSSGKKDEDGDSCNALLKAAGRC